MGFPKYLYVFAFVQSRCVFGECVIAICMYGSVVPQLSAAPYDHALVSACLPRTTRWDMHDDIRGERYTSPPRSDGTVDEGDRAFVDGSATELCDCCREMIRAEVAVAKSHLDVGVPEQLPDCI